MSDEKYENVESLSQGDVVPEGAVAPRPRRPWGLLIVGLLFLALWVWREFGIRVMRESASSQEAEINRLTHENEELTQELDRVSHERAALTRGVARTIVLKGQAAAPAASGRVVFEPTKSRAVVFVYRLPPNPRDKSYQIWMSGPKQPAVSGGVFDVSRRGSAAVVVENLPKDASEYSVTLQARGGEQAPGSNVCLSGVSTTP